ncbi:hypothetical protein [Nocardiopsis lucentensis]|uniref:hypothetical protein n=1 Tax=Nocardiopsis lucentensis TaxID=53441 RepID=UPI00034846E7|nr:hypothetical protein [Nocardiopsis lucentensis]
MGQGGREDQLAAAAIIRAHHHFLQAVERGDETARADARDIVHRILEDTRARGSDAVDSLLLSLTGHAMGAAVALSRLNGRSFDEILDAVEEGIVGTPDPEV